MFRFFFVQLEQEERARIDAIKEEERKKATEAIERWKENQKVQSSKEQEISKVEITELPEDNMSGTKVDLTIEETQEGQKITEKPATKRLQSRNKQQQPHGMVLYYPTLLRRVQIMRETSTNITQYLYSSHSPDRANNQKPWQVRNFGKRKRRIINLLLYILVCSIAVNFYSSFV